MQKTLTFFILIVFLTSVGSAQDSTGSLAFKKNKPQVKRGGFFYHPDPSYQILQQFNLMREANAGDPLAQHELGLRYLFGEGIAADTIKAAYWIGKASDNNLTAACYNYGILLINGWGIKWDPFKAYEMFLKAANDGMPQAQHVIGILHTDNLIVPRNWDKAYLWVKRAADKGFEPAQKTLADLKSKSTIDDNSDTNLPDKDSSGITSKYLSDSSQSFNSPSPSMLGLVFIDFDTVTDTVKEIPDSLLMYDLYMSSGSDIQKMLSQKADSFEINNIDKKDIDLLTKYADAGSPEALTFLGRLYEKGIAVPKNDISAFAFYVRAVRLDSPRAIFLLWKKLKDHSYYSEIERESAKQNPEAMFVWYGLFSLQFDNTIVEKDAVNLLKKSVGEFYLPAITELGLNFYTGKYITKDKQKATELWKTAAGMGSVEASVRIITEEIFNNKLDNNFQGKIKLLQDAESNGSILAQVTLAYCHENGIGVQLNKAEAVKHYREASQRGNRYAYSELKRLYDEIRPSSDKFLIN